MTHSIEGGFKSDQLGMILDRWQSIAEENYLRINEAAVASVRAAVAVGAESQPSTSAADYQASLMDALLRNGRQPSQ